MNKADLVSALEESLGSRSAATEALDCIVDAIVREVARGGKVSITGFGTFDQVKRAPRTGRNPHTGEAVPIPEQPTPRFRAGTAFKDYVQNPGQLPRRHRAVGRAPVGARRRHGATQASGAAQASRD